MKKNQAGFEILVAFMVVGLICVVGWLVYSRQKNVSGSFDNSQDKSIQQDLYEINQAITDHVEDSSKSGDTASLPASLQDLELKLSQDIDTYEYTYKSRTTNGGPTHSYTFCAVFAQQGKMPERPAPNAVMVSLGDNSVDTYAYHRKGRQCYENNYYKGGSHINLLLEGDEIIGNKSNNQKPKESSQSLHFVDSSPKNNESWSPDSANQIVVLFDKPINFAKSKIAVTKNGNSVTEGAMIPRNPYVTYQDRVGSPEMMFSILTSDASPGKYDVTYTACFVGGECSDGMFTYTVHD